MSATFLGVETALRGALAHQQALNVAAHNVANASTPGYTRQNPVFRTTPGCPAPAAGYPEAGPLGTGVTIVQIHRVHDRWLAGRARTSAAAHSYWNVQRQFSERIELVVGQDGGAGINSLMDRFWNAWQQVTQSPQDTGIRAIAISEGRNLAAGLNAVDRELRQLGADARAMLADGVARVNALAQGLADLNAQLRVTGSLGGTPNDLLDQRDRMLAELASLAGVDVYEAEHGAVTVTLGSRILVEGNHAVSLQAPAGTPATVKWPDGSTAEVAQGELAGLLRVANEIVPGHQARLTALKQALVEHVNSLHTTGYDLDGHSGHPFFVIAGVDGEVSVSPLLDNPRMLAASGDGSLGDATVARSIADLRDQPLAALGGSSPREHFSAWVSAAGSEARTLGDLAERAQARRDAILAEQESVSGVNLDEEAARLVQWQRAFSASARMLTVMDELLGTVIEQVGLAGR
ncbi:MAG: flagellar hook-associated protein FlgK [Armatimonadetes bacterium]|jgi:flagellar hook-associated protein 1 FlgK|nr:flagellar hook-associated protein FlgK [Armatimonadota bacterium]